MSPDGSSLLAFEGAANMPEIIVYELGRTEQTRWGMWEVVTEPKKDEKGTITECQKHITVNPGASLSLQCHVGRGETYIGLEGTTHVCINGEVFELKEGDELYIPRGALHFSWNEGDVPSKFHEIQAGPLCDEADIKRSADKYKLAHELDSDRSVVNMMIDVCKSRYECHDFAVDGYNASNVQIERLNDADLINIYLEHKKDTQKLWEEMEKILKNCIQMHWEKTPAPMPTLKEPVAQCKKKV